MPDVKLWRAVNQALGDEFKDRSELVLFGQDVASPGGPYGVTRGLAAAYPDRVRDTPISEAAIMGCAVGAAASGLRPIVDIMFADFLPLAMDQLVNQAAKQRFYLGDDGDLPLVVHTLYGGRAGMGPQHSQALEAWLCHTPGLRVVFPATPQDAYDVMRVAIDEPGPVVVINAIAMLRDTGDLVVDDQWPERGRVASSRQVRAGRQVTVVTYGATVSICEEAIEASGVDAELIDLRWLQPWDRAAVARSLHETTRLVVVHDAVGPGGWASEIITAAIEDEFWRLDAPPTRVTGAATPLPIRTSAWAPLLPSVDDVRAALEKVCRA